MRLWPFRSRVVTRAAEATFDVWKNLPFFGFGQTTSGVTVTAENPITHDTVFSCVNVIAEGCAMLPLYLYRERGASRRLATDHPLFDLFTVGPCPHMTAFHFWKLVLFQKIHYGNHFSLVLRDPGGSVRELYPVDPGRVQPFWYADPASGLPRRAYRIATPSGGAQAVFLEHEVFHVQNLPLMRGPNHGLFGVSVWQIYQSETIGGALATNEFANSSFANGASLSGILSLQGALPRDEELEKLRARVTQTYAGAGKAGRIGIFGGGMTFTPTSQENQKAQLLETRKYNRSVIAGILRVTAHLINDLERGTFSNVEHLDLAHYKHCLRPHLVDLCQTVQKDLLTPEERRTLYVDHDESELLRGDLKTRAEVLEKAIQNGRMTPNEARAEDNRPPKPGGDELYINSASVPVRLAAKGLAGKAGAAAAPQTEEPSDGAEPAAA